ncbi:MAG: SGNH/GDSL hydrolase family protein [Lentisphaeria bacterium]|nr:SGNH/GDSL hydrolase family protein [Lentisphaeria bacterium]
MKFLTSLAILLLAGAAVSAAEVKDVAGKQIELCMIGDSITWAGYGDAFRKELLLGMPELAFVGTHTARYGYSHAGEGGNRTQQILARLDNPERVPASRYYHVLCGINDSASARSHEQVPTVARGTADRILQIVEKLLAKPGTEKVFLGTIMPCAIVGPSATPELKERYVYRDAAGSATNKILRKEAPAKFGDKVVLIEYENPLRALEGREEIIQLHPTEDGYRIVASIAIPVLRAHTKPANETMEKFGVEVTNLWQDQEQCSKPLIPGFYVASFLVKKVSGNEITFTIRTKNSEKYKQPFKQTFTRPAKVGQRTIIAFFTGAESYGYNESPLEIVDVNGEIQDIMMEKMRPSRRGSVYGTGTFIDSTSLMSLGEKFVPVR